jgi:sucrose-6-phosphate hydrolase SacC (GH32 family)
MADLIKKIKIKKQDGTFTDYIPIGAEAQNISMDNGKSVQYNIGDIDVENDGNINEQLKNITTTIDALHYNNENQEVILYCFFNENDNNSIHFYISYDTYNLIEIEPETRLYGRDPSIMYYKGKFYLTMTSYTNTRDFVVYESEDLSTWKQYDINIGLYNATYPKRWAPQWFVDTNDKVYIFLSVEYADTEGWGDFRI